MVVMPPSVCETQTPVFTGTVVIVYCRSCCLLSLMRFIGDHCDIICCFSHETRATIGTQRTTTDHFFLCTVQYQVEESYRVSTYRTLDGFPPPSNSTRSNNVVFSSTHTHRNEFLSVTMIKQIGMDRMSINRQQQPK
jgi:hypothetical protein